MLIKGSDLNSRQRAQVLAAYVHRHTIENAQRRGVACVMCTDSGGNRDIVIPAGHQGPDEIRKPWHEHHIQVVTDAEWIAAHAFHFVKDGSRLKVHAYAERAYLVDDQAAAHG